MNTSNYQICINKQNTISIAGRAPDFFKGKEYKKLAPLYWFFKKYKEDHDKDFYIEQYQKLILDKLNPLEIYNELTENKTNENVILLCWEKPGEFCHRRLVAEWFEKHLNLEVKELNNK